MTEQEVKHAVSPFLLREHITQCSLSEFTELLSVASLIEGKNTKQHHVDRFLQFFTEVFPFMFLKKTTMFYNAVNKAMQIVSSQYIVSIVERKEGEFTEKLRVEVRKLS